LARPSSIASVPPWRRLDASGDGRLTLDELDDRLGAVLSAQTTIELAALIADLPGRRCGPAGPPRPSDQAARPRSCLPSASRWSVIQSLADARAYAGLPAAD